MLNLIASPIYFIVGFIALMAMFLLAISLIQAFFIVFVIIALASVFIITLSVGYAIVQWIIKVIKVIFKHFAN